MFSHALNFAEAGHALVGALMPEYDPVAKISIIPRGQAGGLTFFAPSEERLESGLYSRSYLENQMAVALGGRLVSRTYFEQSRRCITFLKCFLKNIKIPIRARSETNSSLSNRLD